jgi:hypothetical protein
MNYVLLGTRTVRTRKGFENGSRSNSSSSDNRRALRRAERDARWLEKALIGGWVLVFCLVYCRQFIPWRPHGPTYTHFMQWWPHAPLYVRHIAYWRPHDFSQICLVLVGVVGSILAPRLRLKLRMADGVYSYSHQQTSHADQYNRSWDETEVSETYGVMPMPTEWSSLFPTPARSFDQLPSAVDEPICPRCHTTRCRHLVSPPPPPPRLEAGSQRLIGGQRVTRRFRDE